MAKQLDLVDFIGKKRNALALLARKRGYVIEKPKKGLGSYIRKPKHKEKYDEERI